MSTMTMEPAPIRKRYGDYAEKLFDGPRPRFGSQKKKPAAGKQKSASQQARRGAARLDRRGRRAVASRNRARSAVAAEPRRASLRSYAISVIAGLALVLFVHGGVSRGVLEEQRPDPMNYRGQVDLVSIDRVGTMFYAVVSQGFFLQPPEEQRLDLERLVRQIAAEGYHSFYLAEASGRTVAWWNGQELQMLPSGQAGS